MADSSDVKVFVCPFNAYHKLISSRKYQFHRARCKDRRGKSVYHCKHMSAHIFTTPEDLAHHELECEHRNPAKDEDIPECQERQPSQTYCAYNCMHEFTTLEARRTHEETCPDRDQFESKI